MMNVLFYDDGSSFGGHHVTVIDAIQYLVENTDIDVGFLFYEGNIRLHERLNLIKQEGGIIALYPMKYKQAKLKTIGALFSSSIRKIKDLMTKINPDIVIVAQGSIEMCSLGVLAAKRGNYKTVSFIALPQKISVMKGKMALLRDIINLYYYRLPDGFITISNSAKSMLIQHGVKSKISVAYCGPNLKLCKLQDRSEARSKYGIDKGDYVVALIGRIQFVHKGHDFLIDSISKHLGKLEKENIRLIFVGDGPDESLLKSMIKSKNLNNIVSFVPWGNDLSYIYSAIDMLIIPSRFEGIPLVMLEAMYYGIPIVASNLDGIAEVLPREWLFQYGDGDSLIETLLNVKNRDDDNTELLAKNKLRILTTSNAEKFGEKFYEAICTHTS